jgi:hypothetical protein
MTAKQHTIAQHVTQSNRVRRWLGVLGALACFSTIGLSETAQAAYELVYTRQPYAGGPIPGVPGSEQANWQHASDVGRINSRIAEADVVIDDLAGKVEVLFDCTKSAINCIAQEARVSPDGKKIAYSVGFGVPGAAGLSGVYSWYPATLLSIKELPVLRCAQIYIYTIDTGTSVPVPNHPGGDCATIYPRNAPGAIDRQPDWLDNNTLVFSSNRGNTYPFKGQFPEHQAPGRCAAWPYCVSQEYGYGHDGKSMQIWTMKIDGRQAKNISPHEQMALSPAVMTNGDILYSCWNAHGNKSHDSYTSVRPGTAKNKWWLCRVDGNGADETVILNAHKTTYLKSADWLPSSIQGGEGVDELRAIRSAAEIHRGKIAVTNYYRENHVGSMGIIFGFNYTNPHVEGCSTAACYKDSYSKSTVPGTGQYVPSSLRAITPFGQDTDGDVRFKDGMAAGKAGYAAPYSATEILITYGAGSCYEVTFNAEANRTWHGGAPTCWKSIYKVKVPMVTDPFDTNQMEHLAGGAGFQSWDARAITTYQKLYGQKAPLRPEPLDPNAGCYLQVVNARKSELFPAEPTTWKNTMYAHCAHQGCAVNPDSPEFYSKNVKFFSVLIPEMWDITYSNGNETTYANTLNTIGHKSIGHYKREPLLADGSVRMRVPCETPLLMVGENADKVELAHDEMLHSLRAGETRTCHGCHDGHSQERAAQIQALCPEGIACTPELRFYFTKASKVEPQLAKRKVPVTFERIGPILENRCGGCHEGFENDELLYSRIVYDYEQIDFPWLKRKVGQTGEAATPYYLARPHTSWWLSKFALESPLYWYASNKRTDGRTNAADKDDIDYLTTHRSGVTKAEARLIGQWIDQGAQNGGVIANYTGSVNGDNPNAHLTTK